MLEETRTPAPSGRRRVGWAVGMLAAGGVLAGTLSASAADGSTTSPDNTGSAAQGSSTQRAGRPRRAGAGHGSSPVRDDEKALNASDAAKVKAAALKAVAGGTVYRVETDGGDGAYEAHMTKADGTEVTVKLDKNLTVTAVETGKGGPRPSAQQSGSQA